MITGTFPINITGGGSFDSDEVFVKQFADGKFSMLVGEEYFDEGDIVSYDVFYDEVTPAKTYYDGLHGLIGMFAFGLLGSLFGYRVKPSKTSGYFIVKLKDRRMFSARF